MIRRLRGYLRTIRLYYANPKGHHDIVDYSRCIAIILAVSAAVYAVWLILDGGR